MTSANASRRFLGLTLLTSLAFGALFASGCGAKQRTNGQNCASPREGMNATAWDQWAQCTEQSPASAPDNCRASLTYAQSMTPSALEAATRCILSAGVGADGLIIGTAIERVHTTDGRVQAIARGLAPHYRHSIHGQSFANGLRADGERAFSHHLGIIPDDTRNEVIRTAFAWGLRMVATAALPYIHDNELVADDAEAIAQAALGRSDITDLERFALVATGRWGAEEIINCGAGRHSACPDGGDLSHLRLLQHDTRRAPTSVSSARVTEQLHRAQTDPEISAILVDWLARPATPNGQALLTNIRDGMASTGPSLAFRTATAQGANAALCDTEQFNGARSIQRAAAPDAPTAPWLIFLTRCAGSIWTFEDILRIYAHGLDINATPEVRDIMDTRVRHEAEGATCDQVKALADRVNTWRADRIMTNAVVYGELYRVLPRCQATLRATVQTIARDSNAHPEARLAAIGALAEAGDRSQCGSVSSIRTTTVREGDTVRLRGAERRKEAVQRMCR